MTITVDTANALMSLVGGVLALLAAILALFAVLLPREGAAQVAGAVISRSMAALPSAASLIGVVAVLSNWPRTGLAVLGSSLLLLAVQFLRRKGPVSRLEVISLVFQTSVFFSMAGVYLISRVVDTLSTLVNALGK